MSKNDLQNIINKTWEQGLNSWHKAIEHPRVGKIPYNIDKAFRVRNVTFFQYMWFNYTDDLNSRYSHRLNKGTFHCHFVPVSKYGYIPPREVISTLKKYILVFVYRNHKGIDYNPCVQESGTRFDLTLDDIMNRGVREELGYSISSIIPNSRYVDTCQNNREVIFSAIEPKDLVYLGNQRHPKSSGSNDRKRKSVLYITDDNVDSLINIGETWRPFIQTENIEVLNTIGLGIKKTSDVISEFQW